MRPFSTCGESFATGLVTPEKNVKGLNAEC
jgi:hypothetical protein